MPPDHLILTPFSFCLQSFPAPGSFLASQLFMSRGQQLPNLLDEYRHSQVLMVGKEQSQDPSLGVPAPLTPALHRKTQPRHVLPLAHHGEVRALGWVGQGGGAHGGLLWSAENLEEISEEIANPQARRNWPENGEMPEKIMRAASSEISW